MYFKQPIIIYPISIIGMRFTRGDIFAEVLVGALGLLSSVSDLWIGDVSTPSMVTIARMHGLVLFFLQIVGWSIFNELYNSTNDAVLTAVVFAFAVTIPTTAKIFWSLFDIWSMPRKIVSNSYTNTTNGYQMIYLRDISFLDCRFWEYAMHIFGRLMIHSYTLQSSIYTLVYPYIYLYKIPTIYRWKTVFLSVSIPLYLINLGVVVIAMILEAYILFFGSIFVTILITTNLYVLESQYCRDETEHVGNIVEHLVCSCSCSHYGRMYGHVHDKGFHSVMRRACHEYRRMLHKKKIMWLDSDLFHYGGDTPSPMRSVHTNQDSPNCEDSPPVEFFRPAASWAKYSRRSG